MERPQKDWEAWRTRSIGREAFVSRPWGPHAGNPRRAPTADGLEVSLSRRRGCAREKHASRLLHERTSSALRLADSRRDSVPLSSPTPCACAERSTLILPRNPSKNLGESPAEDRGGQRGRPAGRAARIVHPRVPVGLGVTRARASHASARLMPPAAQRIRRLRQGDQQGWAAAAARNPIGPTAAGRARQGARLQRRRGAARSACTSHRLPCTLRIHSTSRVRRSTRTRTRPHRCSCCSGRT